MRRERSGGARQRTYGPDKCARELRKRRHRLSGMAEHRPQPVTMRRGAAARGLGRS